ncbi:MAG TPA: hypothetical protein DGG95_13325 [Cytophagales bacterium]|jgi:hypothetical protein|nr:hypothetical protein [Cytophagales bacterium]
MKLIIFPMAFILMIASTSHAQHEQESVMKPIRQLFEAMQKGDSALLHQTFTKTAALVRVGNDKNGKPFIKQESSISGFLNSVGTPHQEQWNEVIWDEKIEIDGNLAQVWAKYAFYLGKKFNHCGVDAFHLFKGEDGQWRIFHLADTGQKEGCQIPKKIQDQFN